MNEMKLKTTVKPLSWETNVWSINLCFTSSFCRWECGKIGSFHSISFGILCFNWRAYLIIWSIHTVYIWFVFSKYCIIHGMAVVQIWLAIGFSIKFISLPYSLDMDWWIFCHIFFLSIFYFILFLCDFYPYHQVQQKWSTVICCRWRASIYYVGWW